MAEATFESDRILKLVTDALRAGPGSPEWHQAMAELKGQQRQDLDDYALLCRVREDLESGREYRSVRPGPQFTRKVMEGIEQQAAGQKRGLPSANLIALIAGGVILALILVLGWALMKSPEPGADALVGMEFNATVVSSNFAAGWPEQWNAFGQKPQSSSAGLRSATLPKDAPAVIGGATLSVPLEADRPYLVEATVGVEARCPAVEVFISDQPPTTAPANASGHELAVNLTGEGGGLAKVILVAGQQARTAAEQKASPDKGAARIAIRVNRKFAIVTVDGREIYRAANDLSAEGPRFVGVRFIAKPGDKLDGATVQSVRVMKP